MAGALVCPVDGVALDAAGDCRRCGAGWRAAHDLSARAPAAFARLTPDAAADPGGRGRTLLCPACGAPLTPWKIDALAVWMYRCSSCAGWLCPRGTVDTLARRELQLGREAAFASFSPEERAAMAREIAAETADAASDPELPFVHGLLARFGLPVVTRIRRERLPLVTWALALALVAVFVGEWRVAGGIDAAVARLGYGPGNRGLWAATRATFAHAGVGHLLGNFYFLLAFGDGVEQRAPRWLLAPAFVVLGVAALLIDALIHPGAVLLGASGGVAALMGACVVLQPRARVTIHLGPLVLRLSMRGFFAIALILQALMAALRFPGIAWTAHLAGLALGAAGAALLRARLVNRS
jgi:membrane associated rhomboid family serine protease